MAVVSFYILFCSGSTYIFGIYSGAIKESLHYNQETIDTLAFFKDIGANVGIISALLSEVLPPWIILTIGASLNLFGYLMIWLAVMHYIPHPPTWHMYLFLFIGTNSQSFANVGVLVTFVKNFPQGRGEVLGIIKGCVGLSGAIFLQIYLAIYGADTKGVILLIAWMPTLVSLIFMFFIRPMVPIYDKRETHHFYSFLYLALLLAAFLTIAIVVENEIHRISSIAYRAFASITLILVISNIIIAVRAEYGYGAQMDENTSTKSKVLQDLSTTTSKGAIGKDDMVNVSLEDAMPHISSLDLEKDTWCQKLGNVERQDESSVTNLNSPLPKKINCASSSKHWHLSDFSKRLKISKKFFMNWPKRGEDFTISQALLSMDMWILFISISCGLGATLTAIDNMGQIGESQGYGVQSIHTLISLISIWNFLGRVIAGYLSEFLLRHYSFPRTLMLTFVLGLACIGHLLIAFPGPKTLYIASIMQGFSFGAQLPLFLAITSELFGLKYYATLQSLGGIASPLGSYLLNVRVAGHLYDREAQKQHQAILAFAGTHKGGDLKCIGSECFRLTFLIMTMVSACGSLVSSLLVLRTKRFYSKDIYNKFHTKPYNIENQQDT